MAASYNPIMKTIVERTGMTLAAAAVLAATVSAQVTKPAVAGVTNFAKLESTIACAGATTAAAMPELKRLGYNSVINLREASEPGADVEAAASAAKDAGINYVHLPMNGRAPEA